MLTKLKLLLILLTAAFLCVVFLLDQISTPGTLHATADLCLLPPLGVFVRNM